MADYRINQLLTRDGYTLAVGLKPPPHYMGVDDYGVVIKITEAGALAMDVFISNAGGAVIRIPINNVLCHTTAFVPGDTDG